MASRTSSSGLTAIGLMVVGVSLASLVFFMVVFEVSVPTATKVASLPAESRALIPERVANLDLMNQRQNGIIISVGGVVVGVLVSLFGWNAQRDVQSGTQRRVQGGFECPQCGLISPSTALVDSPY